MIDADPRKFRVDGAGRTSGRFDVSGDNPLGRRPSVLLINEDHTARQRVQSYLSDFGLHAFSVSRQQDVTRQLAVNEPSLVILDLPPNANDGFELLREIRLQSDIPVIVVTDDQCDEMVRVIGFELGADDFVTRPFGLRELLARVRAVLRRGRTGPVVPKRSPEARRYRFGGWQLDQRTRRLTDLNGEPVPLTKSEYTLLAAFVAAPQRPLTREQLMRATRLHEDASDRSLDVQVLRLRRKLETDPSVPRVIRTERGVGYVFSLPVEQC
jgi:two-component system, OmpR family, response regulator